MRPDGEEHDTGIVHRDDFLWAATRGLWFTINFVQMAGKRDDFMLSSHKQNVPRILREYSGNIPSVNGQTLDCVWTQTTLGSCMKAGRWPCITKRVGRQDAFVWRGLSTRAVKPHKSQNGEDRRHTDATAYSHRGRVRREISRRMCPSRSEMCDGVLWPDIVRR